MPIANIIDNRSNRYDVNIDAIFEPSCSDNSVKGATVFNIERKFFYDQLYKTTVISAINFAKKWDIPVTLYMYNPGSNPGG